VLDEFSQTEGFPGEGELGFEDGPRGEVSGRGVEAVKVPGVEAGKVLDCAEELVAANYARRNGLVNAFLLGTGLMLGCREEGCWCWCMWAWTGLAGSWDRGRGADARGCDNEPVVATNFWK